jgi:Zn-dependent protease with chaperone function
MLIGSATRLPGVLFRFRLFLLPLLVTVLTLHVWAQDPDDDDDGNGSNGNFANLTLRYDERGKAEATFHSYGDVQNWNGIEAQLERALHCPAGSLTNPPPDPKLPKYVASRSAKEQARYREYAEKTRKSTLEGECQAGMTRTGLLLSTDIPLQALTNELKRASVTKLWASIAFPASKYWEATPGIQRPWDPESDKPRTVCNAQYCETTYLLDTSAPSPAQIHLAFGLRNRDAVRAAILPALFLLSPIVICLWMSRAALRDAKTDPTGAWFSYYRVLVWCGNCLVLIWMMGQTIRQGVEVIASYYTSGHTAGAVALQVGIMMLPPWLAFFICILLSYRVYRQVRGETWTRREFFVNQFLGIAAQFLPLACLLAAIGMISVNGQASVGLFAGVYISYVVCKWLQVKYSGLHIEPLTRGELRDRVFEIAKKAAVEVREVFIVPSGKSQMANAFASRNHMVMFTDYLLSRLNKREVSAIAAHEIAHIQRRHPAWKMGAFLVLIFSSQILYGILSSMVGFLRHGLQVRQAAEGANAAAGLSAVVRYADQVLAFPELILILFALSLFLYHLHSQHLEYVADAGSVQFTGDPEAMITSLLKLSQLNQTPVQWDRATESFLTHPSTLKRVQRIARIGQVAPDRLQQILTDYANNAAQQCAGESWAATEQFDIARPGDTVVTLQSVAGELAFRKWTLRLSLFAPTTLIAWAVMHYHVQHKAAVYGLGGLLCLALYVAIEEWQGTWFRESLKRRFVARLTADGIDADVSAAKLVALSPHAVPRLYVLGLTWDTGFLFMCKDRLCYVGDQIRFALKTDQVVALRLGPGSPDCLPQPRVYVDWQCNSEAPAQTWNLLPLEPGAIWPSKKQSVEFHAKLEHWKSLHAEYPDVSTVLSALGSPAAGEVTSHRIKKVINFGRFVKVALFNLVLAVIVCIILNVPAVWFVCLVSLLAVVCSFVPFWFYKERDEGNDAATSAKNLRVQEDLQSVD